MTLIELVAGVVVAGYLIKQARTEEPPLPPEPPEEPPLPPEPPEEPPLPPEPPEEPPLPGQLKPNYEYQFEPYPRHDTQDYINAGWPQNDINNYIFYVYPPPQITPFEVVEVHWTELPFIYYGREIKRVEGVSVSLNPSQPGYNKTSVDGDLKHVVHWNGPWVDFNGIALKMTSDQNYLVGRTW